MRNILLSFLFVLGSPGFGATVTYSFTQGLGLNPNVLAQFTVPDFLAGLPSFPGTTILTVSRSGLSVCSGCPTSYPTVLSVALTFNIAYASNTFTISNSYFDSAQGATVNLFTGLFPLVALSQVGSYPAGAPEPSASLIVAQRGDPITDTPEPATLALVLMPIVALVPARLRLSSCSGA